VEYQFVVLHGYRLEFGPSYDGEGKYENSVCERVPKHLGGFLPDFSFVIGVVRSGRVDFASRFGSERIRN
jgi:protein involved in ribonucleotide reduction